MAPRSDGRRHRLEPRVDADRCAACGICAGACPSSVPLGGRDPLVSGIELPGRSIAALRGEVDRALAAGGALVFRCETVEGGGIAVPCVAMVPPSFVQYALRHGARDVSFEACAADDCEHRLGDRWMRERFAGQRAPRLRASVPRERVRLTFGRRTP
jgi:ferredoxin